MSARGTTVQSALLTRRTEELVLGMVLLGLVGWGSLATNVPCALAPFSLVIAIPMLATNPVLGAAIPPLFFLSWTLGLRKGPPGLPFRSVVRFVALITACLLHFVFGWKHGLQHQGIELVVTWACMNVALVVWLASLARRLGPQSTWRNTLLFHWLLFAWPIWCGFPWLGELL